MKMQTKVNNGLERKKNNQMRETKKRTYIYIWNKVYNVHVYTFWLCGCLDYTITRKYSFMVDSEFKNINEKLVRERGSYLIIILHPNCLYC